MANKPRRKTPEQKSRGRYAPALWPVWAAALLTLLVAAAASYGIYRLVHDLAEEAATKAHPPDNLDVLKVTLAVLTLTGAVLAGLYAYRKQRLVEGDAQRADAAQLAQRYTTAADQLGHDKAAVRLAGVYAMARLADDWEDQRQVCIDVLCAYLRMPYEPDPASERHKEGDREVRHTIIRVIRDHLQQEAPISWSACHFDFTGATFDCGNLSRSHFRGLVSFDYAQFTGGTVSFDYAQFTGSTVSFYSSKFRGGTVSFDKAQFSDGAVIFFYPEFSGGTVSFDEAQFSDGEFVAFYEAQFSGSTVSFNKAQFSDGEVAFYEAQFSGSTVHYDHAKFSGGQVSFDKAQFTGGQVSFDEAQFTGGQVSFDKAQFTGGQVSFREAQLSGGEVSFKTASHTGGAVTFAGIRIGGAARVRWGPFRPPAA